MCYEIVVDDVCKMCLKDLKWMRRHRGQDTHVHCSKIDTFMFSSEPGASGSGGSRYFGVRPTFVLIILDKQEKPRRRACVVVDSCDHGFDLCITSRVKKTCWLCPNLIELRTFLKNGAGGECSPVKLDTACA